MPRMACIAILSTLLYISSTEAVKNTVRRNLIEGPATISKSDAIAMKPAFHITGESGWINDPGGMFEYNGYLHIFPQANPTAPIWAAPNWAHLVSKDRVHYQRVRPACVADTPYDENGCWTGSCFPSEDGTPVCWYTAASGAATLGYNKQQVAMLKPLNASDPLLKYWIKPAQNPLYAPLPDGVYPNQWRDPHSPWLVDGKWFTFIGGAYNCLGATMLYSTKNLTNATFAYEGILGDQLSLDQDIGQCQMQSTPDAAGSTCNQFGAVCQVWECPDYFNLTGGINVLKYSDQSNFRGQFAQDLYVLSDQQVNLQSQALTSRNISTPGNAAFQNILGNGKSPSRLLDFGSIYASKSWKDVLGRRLNLGWVFETAQGCDLQCSAGTNFTDTLGYQGSHHLIREMTYNNATRTLRHLPIPEYSNLKEASLYNGTVPFSNATQSPVFMNGTPTQEKLVKLATDDRVLQSDLQANFSITSNSSASQTFLVGAVINFNSPSHMVAYISGNISNGTVTQAAVYFDLSNLTDTNTNTSTVFSNIPLPALGLSSNNLEFRLVTDHSQLEVYALGGMAVGSIKIYPNNISKGNWTMSVISSPNNSLQISAKISLDYWHSCWIKDATAQNPTLVSAQSANSLYDDIVDVSQVTLAG